MTPAAALWISIVLGACAQVFLKRGVSPRTGARPTGMNLLFSPWVLAWAGCFVLATLLWLIALSKIEISYAFPLLSLGYPVVAIFSMLFLKERISLVRWVAILVVTAGVAIIWRAS